MKRLLQILALTLLLGSFVGCHQQTDNPKSSAFFEWTDSYGRAVVLDTVPQRIVSLSPAITEIFYMIGAEKKLVAVSDFCHYPPEATKLPSVGGMRNINMESLLEQHPDVLLIGSMVSQKDVEAIEKMNIPVVTIKEESNIEGMADMIEVIGQITECQERAKQEATRWRDRIAQLKQDKAALEGNEKSVYYVVGFGDAGDFTAPKGSHIHEIIELAGCRNIGETVANWNVSREFLFKSDPDIIIIRAEDCDAFKSQYPYTQLNAVKKGHVYPIESGWIDIVSTRNLQAIEFIQQKARELDS
ncbi:MAG: ABC transporter substrate-binding protein [Bacteroidales bacterium]|nr:ABC transporter substrate-binding protein [Bacteroidales bacterium]